MSSNPLSIQQSQQQSQKQILKNWLGYVLSNIMPSRASELEQNPVANPDSFSDKAIMFHLRRRAITENRQDFLERLHLGFWASEEGAKFSDNCDHRFEDLFLAKQQMDYKILQSAWNSLKCSDIVEIGTNSGLLLEHLTANLAHASRSIGIDINPEQIQRNIESGNFDPKIQFLCTDGQQWILDNANPSTLFVTNGGVLEYFRREKLDQLMSHISNHCQPSVFFASEPVAHDHDFETNRNSIPFGEELSFSHNYKDIFESNGFQVIHQRAVMFESWKMQVTIAVTGENKI